MTNKFEFAYQECLSCEHSRSNYGTPNHLYLKCNHIVEEMCIDKIILYDDACIRFKRKQQEKCMKELDIRKHKPEELQQRNGNKVISIYPTTNALLVVYQNSTNDYDALYIEYNGRINKDKECSLDVILKPKPKQKMVKIFYKTDSSLDVVYESAWFPSVEAWGSRYFERELPKIVDVEYREFEMEKV